jgi:small GTP-binding protein
MARQPRSSRSPSLVPRKLARERGQVLEFVRRGQQLAAALGDPGLGGEIDQLSVSALKPFLFVIVGEVKSGKSSLINALLEAPVCAVDSAPCTTRVQEISYGEEESRTEVSEFEEHVHLPHAILKHIAIVDTPGTNSIIREHQRITENYIPQSDLVLFVFFAKNPYTGSAWDFLRYIKHDWQRNTLFVLQQADLLDAAELERTLSLVKQQLAAENIAEPVVFPVSVLTGEGLDVLREYLRMEVVQGRQFNKSISLTHNVLRFLRRMEAAVHDHECLLEQDEGLLGELRQVAVGLGPEADQEYATLTARVRHQAEEVRQWLAGQSRVADGPAPNLGRTGGARRDWRSLLARAREFGEALAGRVALGDALSSGWDRSLRTAERFNRLQLELNRCLFRGQLRRIDLYRQLKGQLKQQLDAVLADPPCLSGPRDDALARTRRQALSQARDAVQGLGEIGLENPIPRPALGFPSPWPPAYGAAQVGAGLGCLVLGYHFDDLLAGLLLAVVGYLGAGYALAARSRARIGAQADAALQRSLEDVDRRLREALLTQPPELQAALQDMLGRLERDLAERRARTEELLPSINALREDIKRFQSEAWIDAVQNHP